MQLQSLLDVENEQLKLIFFAILAMKLFFNMCNTINTMVTGLLQV